MDIAKSRRRLVAFLACLERVFRWEIHVVLQRSRSMSTLLRPFTAPRESAAIAATSILHGEILQGILCSSLGAHPAAQPRSLPLRASGTSTEVCQTCIR